MKTIARLAVVAAIAVAPVAAVTTPAHACTDPRGECLVRCIEDLVAQGSCRL